MRLDIYFYSLLGLFFTFCMQRFKRFQITVKMIVLIKDKTKLSVYQSELVITFDYINSHSTFR